MTFKMFYKLSLHSGLLTIWVYRVGTLLRKGRGYNGL